MPLSSAIAKELSRRVLANAPPAESNGRAPDCSEDDDEEEARRLRAALSDLVDVTLGEEIAAQAGELAGGGGDGTASAASDDAAKALSERAADAIVSGAPAYQLLEDAVRQAAAARTSDGDARDVGAAVGNKKARRDVDTDGGCDNSRSDAVADEVWGVNDYADCADYDDPFAATNANASTTGATPTNAGAGKSFSLFDMLDSQRGAGIGTQRVSAQEILRAFGTVTGSANGGDNSDEGDPNARYNEVASLLERADDLEDLLFDPFGSCTTTGGGSGDVWPDINRVLRSGLGLGLGDDATAMEHAVPPSPDVIVRFARIHLQLDGLCGSSSSSSGIDFGPQRIDLVVNVADALVTMHSRLKESWCCAEESGEVHMAEDGVTLVQIMLDMLISSAPALELVQEEDCHRLLVSVLKMLAVDPMPECGGIGLAHAVSAADPYAEWFSFLSRFVRPATLIKAFTKTRVLQKVVQFCNEGPGRIATTKWGNTATSGSDMVAVGTAADLDHCLYLHSLSTLRTLLVVTAGSERIFPYQELDTKQSDSLFQSVMMVLAPFVKVLSAGAKEGTAVVDESLAYLCEESSKTVLRGIKQNKEVFVDVFQTIIVPVADEVTTATDGNPSVAAIMRLKLMAG